ncbi:MAG: AraC family transcriptional regulator [bacterium]|nr:AraC family transcriptional regulator [bacterium]MDY2649986.1 AraC family transcriptional regulator [Candidatus Egerieousia sp.]
MITLLFTSLPMFACCFWAILIGCTLCFDGYNRRYFILLLFMLMTTLLYAGHCAFFNHFYSDMPVLDSLYSFANLAVYPLFYVFILSMTSPESQLRHTWLYFIPSAVIGIMVSAIYVMMSSQELDSFVRIISYNEEYGSGTGLCKMMGYTRLTAKAVFAIETVAVLFAGSRKITAYNKSIEDYYADTEGKKLTAFQWFMYLFTACSFVSIIFNFIGRFRFNGSAWMIAIPSLIFSSLLFGLGFISFRQSFTIDRFEQEESADRLNPDTAPVCKEEKPLIERIEEVVTKRQLFLRHNLKISDVAAELCTNRLYVSTAINEEIGISFSDYINRKRVNYAIQLIRSNPQMTIYEIADLSGFASDKSFYRNFKSITGKSPKEIRQ